VRYGTETGTQLRRTAPGANGHGQRKFDLPRHYYNRLFCPVILNAPALLITLRTFFTPPTLAPGRSMVEKFLSTSYRLVVHQVVHSGVANLHRFRPRCLAPPSSSPPRFGAFWTAATRRRFGPAGHVAPDQSADTSAHSKVLRLRQTKCWQSRPSTNRHEAVSGPPRGWRWTARR
jgi:hypothetical protein